jgi:hypothetical protein
MAKVIGFGIVRDTKEMLPFEGCWDWVDSPNGIRVDISATDSPELVAAKTRRALEHYENNI